MTQHTPTPWVRMLNFQIAAQTREIACFTSHHLFAPESKANRDFALRACNSHDDLLAALKAGDELWAMLPFDSGADIAEIAERVQDIQDAAIAKAEEGS